MNRSYVFENVIDLDAESLYPSLMMLHNIFKATLYGHITEAFDTLTGENIGNGEDICQKIMTIDQSILDFSKEYFNLPTIEEMINEINSTIENKIEKN